MPIDKSWTTLRNRNCDAYWNGLQAFLKMAKEHVDCDGRVLCPCVRCLNVKLQTIDTVEAHIFDKGFQQNYQKWVYHGEVEVGVANKVVEENEDVDDFISTTNAEEADGVSGSRMRQYYDELFDEIEAELYPGCDWISSSNFLVKLMHLKVRGKWPNDSFDELLKLLKFAFPKNNKIPPTHYEVKKKLSNSFVNDDARKDYEKLKADFELQTQQTSICASNNGDSTTVDQVEVLQKVLGQRHGHERGVGCKLKGSGSSSTQHSHFSESQAPPHHSREYIEKLENNLQKLTDQVNFLSQSFLPSFRPPNVQMPPMPHSENIFGASSSQPPVPTHPSTCGVLPFQHMVPPYMYGATPYPWPIPPSSQPSYPYMYGVGSSTLPLQYPWPMSPPQQPQPQQEDNREDEAVDLGD
ncbi:uncharacterized protein LOC133801361 [Humulus lupulus]|uniref:uncharacterized protein LOC133801361 n=1 Tax=Humulus lupulus TaxID=3486 RepID=UPI002B40BB78|nr:uncharacterized protein LOC133801361 [Humulus lupulus]